MKEHLFCVSCGNLLVERETIYYDGVTGKRTKEKVCLTHGCSNNRICNNSIHSVGIFSNKCKRCDRIICD